MELPKLSQEQLEADMAYLIDKAFADGEPLADDSYQFPLDVIYGRVVQAIRDGGANPSEIRDSAWAAFKKHFPSG